MRAQSSSVCGLENDVDEKQPSFSMVFSLPETFLCVRVKFGMSPEFKSSHFISRRRELTPLVSSISASLFFRRHWLFFFVTDPIKAGFMINSLPTETHKSWTWRSHEKFSHEKRNEPFLFRSLLCVYGGDIKARSWWIIYGGKKRRAHARTRTEAFNQTENNWAWP